MNTKKILAGASALTLMLLSAAPVFAHAVVSPKQVGVAAFQDFTLGVPSEKEATTTSIRLLLPAGLNFVSPVVKPGWNIEVKSGPIPSGMTAPVAADGDVADSIPTEIDWTGGAIPTGQKDLFVFSAQVPAQETELDWKVYQSFSDGSTVSWDLGPNDTQPKDDKGNVDYSASGPFSKTMVVNDLKTDLGMGTNGGNTEVVASQSKKPLYISVLALLLSVVALGMQYRKKG